MKKVKMKIQNSMTFKEGCELYLVDCQDRNLRDGTLKHWREAIVNMFHYIDAETPIEKMTIKTFKNYILAIKKNDDIGDMTLYTYCRDLKTMMYFFIRKEFIPYFKITIPKADKPAVETYTDKEIEALLKKPNMKKCSFSEYKAWVIVKFLLSTGVRQNSLSNIMIKDVDFDNLVVYVNVTKNRKPLIVPLNSDIVRILREYLRYRNTKEVNDYLFCNVYGQKLTKSILYHSIYDYNEWNNIM